MNKRGRGHAQRLRAQRAHKRQRHKPTTSLGCPYCITVAEDRFHEVKVAHHGPGDDEAHLPVHTHPSRIRQAWPQIAACVCVRAFLRQHLRATRTCQLRLSLTNCVCVEHKGMRAALIPTAGRKNNLTRRCTANMALCIAYLGRLLLDVALHLGAGQRAQQQRREDLGRFLLLGSCVHVVVEVG